MQNVKVCTRFAPDLKLFLQPAADSARFSAVSKPEQLIGWFSAKRVADARLIGCFSVFVSVRWVRGEGGDEVVVRDMGGRGEECQSFWK